MSKKMENLFHDGKGRAFMVLTNEFGVEESLHVDELVCEVFHGSPKPGQVVCHINGDITNDNAANLRWQERATSEKIICSVPRTVGDIIYIPIADPHTGKPTGEEAMIDVDNEDMAAHRHWHRDNSGVYTIAQFLRVPIRVYMHDLVFARSTGQAVIASGIAPEHEPPSTSREADFDLADLGKIAISEMMIGDDEGAARVFSTSGLKAYGHLELEVIAPGFCRDNVTAALLEGARSIVQDGNTFEHGDTVTIGHTPCVLFRIETSDGQDQLRIIEIGQEADSSDKNSCGDEID